MSDKIINFLLVTCGILVIVIALIVVVASYMMVLDTKATIKIKERIAENGIEITNKQIQALVESEVSYGEDIN